MHAVCGVEDVLHGPDYQHALAERERGSELDVPPATAEFPRVSPLGDGDEGVGRAYLFKVECGSSGGCLRIGYRVQPGAAMEPAPHDVDSDISQVPCALPEFVGAPSPRGYISF